MALTALLVTWTKGYQYMYGEEALQYVRTRYGLAGGDFDRIRRLDRGQSSDLWDSLSADKVSKYAAEHQADQLPGEKNVN